MTPQDLVAVIATEVEQVARSLGLGDRGTAGPAADTNLPALPAPSPIVDHPNWSTDGYWSEATAIAPHPARVGGPIDAVVVVDHTTDMHEDDWDALKQAWIKTPGDGALIHFLVGVDEAHGVLQFASIHRNGNHVGGKTPPNGHGWFHDPARPGVNIHPNLLAIGIEFHGAGGMVRLIDGAWRFVEDGKIHGAPIAPEKIMPDPQRPGRGWQLLTPYQQAVRARLHADLDQVLKPMPAGLRAVSTGEAVPSWGTTSSTRFLAHVTLDPTNRADPWPPNMAPIH